LTTASAHGSSSPRASIPAAPSRARGATPADVQPLPAPHGLRLGERPHALEVGQQRGDDPLGHRGVAGPARAAERDAGRDPVHDPVDARRAHLHDLEGRQRRGIEVHAPRRHREPDLGRRLVHEHDAVGERADRAAPVAAGDHAEGVAALAGAGEPGHDLGHAADRMTTDSFAFRLWIVMRRTA
jgi:hypothetical protein